MGLHRQFHTFLAFSVNKVKVLEAEVSAQHQLDLFFP